MAEINELKRITQDGTRLLEKRPDVKEVEVFASSNTLNIFRIAYSSDVPSNGLEEPKSLSDFGVSVRVFFKNGKIGFGKENSSISIQAVKNAFEKAKKNAVLDTDFKSLPMPSKKRTQKQSLTKKLLHSTKKKQSTQLILPLADALIFWRKKSFWKT